MITSSLPATVLESARLLLLQRRPALASRDVEAKAELRPSQDGRSCEIRVTFWRGSSLVDFFEDFVVRDGVPVASEEEISSWLTASVDDALEELGVA